MESQLEFDVFIKECKDWLKRKSANWGDGVCCGGTATLEKGILDSRYPFCHSWVTIDYIARGIINYGWGRTPTKEVDDFFVLSCHSWNRSKGIVSREAFEAIVLFIAESPLGRFIVNRDDKESLFHGVIIRCGIGENSATIAECMWICKVLRYAVEAGKSLDVWLTLKNEGVHSVFALVIASVVRTIQGATFGYTGPETHSSVFFTYGMGPQCENIVGALAWRINRSAQSTVCLFKQPVKPKKPLQQISVMCKDLFNKTILVDDGWGNKIKTTGIKPKDFIKKVKKLQHEYEQLLEG